MDMSLEMLREAHQQGIKEIVNTVHYQHPKLEGLEITYGLIKKKHRCSKMNWIKTIFLLGFIGSSIFSQIL